MVGYAFQISAGLQIHNQNRITNSIDPIYRSNLSILSSKPPNSFIKRPTARSESPIIAWLKGKRSEDQIVINAAKFASQGKCFPIHTQDVHSVISFAYSSKSNKVFLHLNSTTAQDICTLRSFGLIPVPIGCRSKNKSHFIQQKTHMLVGMAIATPTLIETKGESVTRFFEDHNDPESPLIEETVDDTRSSQEKLIAWLIRVYLPQGFPHTTTPDYISFTKYRTLQNLASAIMSVISTEALLFGLGLGKTVAAGAAATSWVLKDGASYLVKIGYGSVFGSKFDDDPKSWRIAADIVEDVGGAIEILTPLFPLSYFLPLASLAVCLRGMSLMTGTATRHVVYRSLAASGMQNTGDIATKGESQGVTMKMIGLGTGIIISNRIGQRYYALLAAYGLLAAVHIAANWKSVQCVQFSFFNKQRASVLIDSHLENKEMPTPLLVSKTERIILPPWKGYEPHIRIGAPVAEAVSTSRELRNAIRQCRGERFLILSKPHGPVDILLHEKATSKDALRAYYTVKRFIQNTNGSKGSLADSLTFMKRNIRDFERSCERAGWDLRHMLLTNNASRTSW